MYKGQINSDLVIEPELKIYKNTSLDSIDERIEEGYKAAVKVMDEIKQLILAK